MHPTTVKRVTIVAHRNACRPHSVTLDRGVFTLVRKLSVVEATRTQNYLPVRLLCILGKGVEELIRGRVCKPRL